MTHEQYYYPEEVDDRQFDTIHRQELEEEFYAEAKGYKMTALSWIEFIELFYNGNHRSYMHKLGLHINGQYPSLDVKTYADFINQPFTPEMIVEKFKGWERDCEYPNFYNDTSNKIRFTNGDIYYINGIKFLIPRTLSDFITDCQRAGIE